MEFDEKFIQKVWDKGRVIPDKDFTIWRQDECGAWIKRDHFDNEASEFGWKIEKISIGNSKEVKDFKPFHRDNNYHRETGEAQCHITADRENISPTATVGSPRNKYTD